MKVLVVGGTGNTGARLVARLAGQGHDVSVFTRRTEADPVVRDLIRQNITIERGDLAKSWTLIEALKQKDALIGCAHIRHSGVCAVACRLLGVRRYLQMSSTRGLSSLTHQRSVREVRAGEKRIQKSGLDYTIIRPTMIFGGPQDRNVARLVDWFRRHRWMPLVAGGECLIQPVFVDDVVEVLIKALGSDNTTGQVYTVGGETPVAWKTFVEQIGAACGREKITFLPIPGKPLLSVAGIFRRHLALSEKIAEFVERMSEDRIADSTDAARDLDFRPTACQVAIEETVRRCQSSSF